MLLRVGWDYGSVLRLYQFCNAVGQTASRASKRKALRPLFDRDPHSVVEPETSQCLRAAVEAGTPTVVPVGGIAADSLGSRQLGHVPWEVVRRYVDESVTVTDDAIRATQRAIWDELRLISEPGGAAALAAIRSGVYRPERSERVVVVLCGSNCDPATVAG